MSFLRLICLWKVKYGLEVFLMFVRAQKRFWLQKKVKKVKMFWLLNLSPVTVAAKWRFFSCGNGVGHKKSSSSCVVCEMETARESTWVAPFGGCCVLQDKADQKLLPFIAVVTKRHNKSLPFSSPPFAVLPFFAFTTQPPSREVVAVCSLTLTSLVGKQLIWGCHKLLFGKLLPNWQQCTAGMHHLVEEIWQNKDTLPAIPTTL